MDKAYIKSKLEKIYKISNDLQANHPLASIFQYVKRSYPESKFSDNILKLEANFNASNRDSYHEKTSQDEYKNEINSIKKKIREEIALETSRITLELLGLDGQEEPIDEKQQLINSQKQLINSLTNRLTKTLEIANLAIEFGKENTYTSEHSKFLNDLKARLELIKMW